MTSNERQTGEEKTVEQIRETSTLRRRLEAEGLRLQAIVTRTEAIVHRLERAASRIHRSEKQNKTAEQKVRATAQSVESKVAQASDGKDQKPEEQGH